MKLHYVTISIIFVSMIVLGTTAYINDLGQNYGTTADFTALNNTQTNLDAQTATADELYNITKSFKLNINPFASEFILYTAVKAGIESIRLVLDSYGVLQGIFEDLGSGFAAVGIILPTWLISSIVAIIIVILVFIAIYAFIKWKLED